MKLVYDLNKSQMKKNLPEVHVGDKIKITQKIKEGEKEKTSIFEGIVISKKGELHMLSVIVRKIGAAGIGVEKTFLLHHPSVTKIQVLRKSKVRRAKLYYLRALTGKKAKLKEKEMLGEAIVWEEEKPVLPEASQGGKEELKPETEETKESASIDDASQDGESLAKEASEEKNKAASTEETEEEKVGEIKEETPAEKVEGKREEQKEDKKNEEKASKDKK